MRIAMNQRVAVIAIVSVFALCFVGSGIVATVTLVSKLTEAPSSESAPDASVPVAATSMDNEPVPQELEDEEPEKPYRAPTAAVGEFAVFHVAKPHQEPWKALQKAAKATPFQVFQGTAPQDAAPPYIVYRDVSAEAYGSREDRIETGRDLTPAMKTALHKPKRISVLNMTMPLGSLFEASSLMARFAQLTGGVLWDQEAEEFFSLAAWKERRVDSWDDGVPYALLHFTLFVDGKTEGLTLGSSGLNHFGFPELEIRQVSRSSRNAAALLLNAIAQTFAERGTPVVPGDLTVDLGLLKHGGYLDDLEGSTFENAQQRVQVRLVPLSGRDVPTLLVTFPGEGAANELAQTGFESLLGWEEPALEPEHDDALMEISKQQMDIYRKEVKRRFRKGLEYNEVLLVKAALHNPPTAADWVWVEVFRLGPRGKVTGRLLHVPPGDEVFRSGGEVTVAEKDCFDWKLVESDGTVSGDETSRQRREK